MKYYGLGGLRPTVGNTAGLTTRFSGRYPIKLQPHLHPICQATRPVQQHQHAQMPPRAPYPDACRADQVAQHTENNMRNVISGIPKCAGRKLVPRGNKGGCAPVQWRCWWKRAVTPNTWALKFQQLPSGAGGQWDLIQFPMAGETSGILHRHLVRKNASGPLFPEPQISRRRCLAGLWARLTSTLARSPPRMSVPP